MQKKTFFMLKPDAVARKLEDEIFGRIVKAGLKVKAKKKLLLSSGQAAELYLPHLGKSFYAGLIRFITSGPVVCGVVEGEEAIEKVREIMGATDPRVAQAGTIRADLQEENIYTEEGIIKNLVHGSDSETSAKREMGIFFTGEG